MPIAVKYAGITAVLLLLAMWILGNSLLKVSLTTAESLINDQRNRASYFDASPWRNTYWRFGRPTVTAAQRTSFQVTCKLSEPFATVPPGKPSVS